MTSPVAQAIFDTWPMPQTREELETALLNGRLYVSGYRGSNALALRRNGATKTWKRTPDDFRVPVKYGFKSYAALDTSSLASALIRMKPQ